MSGDPDNPESDPTVVLAIVADGHHAVVALDRYEPHGAPPTEGRGAIRVDIRDDAAVLRWGKDPWRLDPATWRFRKYAGR